VRSGGYDFIAINFANADMVGHTGNIKATISACETVDACVGELVNTVVGAGGVILITADHGNAEEMINLSTGVPDTEHNANPVPCIIAGNMYRNATQVPQGILADVAPTLLNIMGIPIPLTMTGRNLLSTVGIH
jgi:2,3-bisphosphoglycerate-independent phosphoglycerate mutase